MNFEFRPDVVRPAHVPWTTFRWGAIVKKRLSSDASLYTLLQILSLTLFEKIPVRQALAGEENRCDNP